MSEEKKNDCVCECTCHKEWLRQLLVVCFGTFAGVYLALGLDHFVNRPPVIVPISYYAVQAPAPMDGHFKADRPQRPHKPNERPDKKPIKKQVKK